MKRDTIIQHYIAAYNQFDVNGMIRDLDEHVVFRNIQSGEVNMVLNGIKAFTQQAEQACAYFESRTQLITAMQHDLTQTTINIDYTATLAIDLPNGMKKGDTLALKGQSVFTFENDKIVAIDDIA